MTHQNTVYIPEQQPPPLAPSPITASAPPIAAVNDTTGHCHQLYPLQHLKVNMAKKVQDINHLITMPKFTQDMWKNNTTYQHLLDSHPGMTRAMNKHIPREHCVVDEETSPEINIAHDLIAGGVAGSASVVVGHPFDTVKVRLQMSSASGGGGGMWKGGVSSLFRGMGAPLSTATLLNAVVFSSFGYSSRLWDGHFGVVEGEGSADWRKNFICGSFAGLVNCLLICPTEHIKCRLQVQGSGNHPSYRGPLHVISSIYSSQGIRGLFRGWWVTSLREVPAFGLYFAIYDSLKEKINSVMDTSESHSWLACALAGGVSGSCTWAIVYPFDVIKTRIQTSSLDSTRVCDRRMWYVGRKIVRDYGWQFMFRGLGVTLFRAFPVNGIIFPVYEFTLMHLVDNQDV
eukprot:CAMPEP_0172504026 /NCGR_PEP_ID=MMETSP1066-20121228/174681_1 /TAXON_ID=671091 /ORGANISM="Coscinodiscus wailesii, Strain CCMP2513" /LENGTH=399 /DNA_ID=CAMNT_0013280015 /DNA_START=124 /DNA_END=1323 /DNA_ORIENTATION=-